MNDDKRIKVIDKSIDILMLFLEKKEPLGITEISKDLQIYKSSVHRILNTLMIRGFIKQDSVSKKYWLGSKFYSLGMLYQNKLKLRDIVKPYLKELAGMFQETVHLAIYDELDYSKVVVIDRVEGSNLLSLAPPAGSRNPTHASAVGKALLAFSTEDIQRTVLAHPLKKFTGKTITEKDVLKGKLKKIKEQGYAMDDQELESGLVCFAAPILDNEKKAVASISVSGPGSRILDKKKEIIEYVKNAAWAIGGELR